jgi:hypothetical protein
MVNSLSQCVFAMSVRFLCDGVSMKALIFATQGGAVGNVDITRWIAGLRDGNPVAEYAEVQASFVARTRASLVQGVVTDALTATFLLNGNSMTSDIGRRSLLRFAKLLVTYDEDSMSLGLPVRKLVPQLQVMCNPSLSDKNLKAVVQKVMELSLKPRASNEWVMKTIGNVMQAVRAVTNNTCGQVLKELTSAVVPARVMSIRKTNSAALRVVEVKATDIKVKDNKVCFIIVGLSANTCVCIRV